ncbi:hypothetical protein [Turicimonas muris]|uniref:hypothetical protein n=1 Tax=Turicimonas muris TaxID=1796652 RepID=UPI00248BDE00|nr:hypothetical protein [Turicimonas muris]
MKLKEFIEENGDREIVDIEALEKCLEHKKPKTIWDVKAGDMYFYLNGRGSIKKVYWDNHPVDKEFQEMGMAFLTKEEAEIRKKMLLIEGWLMRLGGRREFKSSGGNWYLKYDLHLDELIVKKPSCGSMQQDIYFDTKEDVVEAIDALGSQRIINEYFKPRIIKEIEL